MPNCTNHQENYKTFLIPNWNMEEIFVIYKEIMESQGGITGNLLEVLKQGMHHNKEIPVIKRTALVQRHMRDAQTALEHIYEVAKNRGYKDITDIF